MVVRDTGGTHQLKGNENKGKDKSQRLLNGALKVLNHNSQPSFV